MINKSPLVMLRSTQTLQATGAGNAAKNDLLVRGK